MRNRKIRYNVSVLASRRDELGLTNLDIVKRLRAVGIERNPATISRTLSGHPHHQSPRTVKAVADLLGVAMLELRPEPQTGDAA